MIKTNRKPLISLVIVLLIALALAACGGGADPTPTSTPVPPAATATPVPPTATPVPRHGDTCAADGYTCATRHPCRHAAVPPTLPTTPCLSDRGRTSRKPRKRAANRPNRWDVRAATRLTAPKSLVLRGRVSSARPKPLRTAAPPWSTRLIIRELILTPSAKVVADFPDGVMPQDFGRPAKRRTDCRPDRLHHVTQVALGSLEATRTSSGVLDTARRLF